jgi:hypothetical protein
MTGIGELRESALGGVPTPSRERNVSGFAPWESLQLAPSWHDTVDVPCSGTDTVRATSAPTCHLEVAHDRAVRTHVIRSSAQLQCCPWPDSPHCPPAPKSLYVVT